MASYGWRDIALDLRGQIERGELAPGDRLPTEQELAARYGVQRNIVTIAFRDLMADGLVVRKRRLGTFVRDRDPVRVPFSVYQQVVDPQRPLADLGPWETACASVGLAGSAEVISVDTVEATPRVAERLSIEAGSPVVQRVRHLRVGNSVAQIQRTYMPTDLVSGTALAGSDKVVGGVYAAFASAGMEPTAATFYAVARMPSSEERAILGLGQGVPILETWRVTKDQTGRSIELLHSIAAAESAILVFDELPLRRA